MGAILDIVLSLAIRGAIVLAVLNATVTLQYKLQEKTVQSNEVDLVNTVFRILKYDFDKVGYNFSGPPFFSYASADTIAFSYSLALSPASSSPISVRYYLGSTTELSSTPNPNDRILYRSVNGGPGTNVARGVTRLKFKYFDVNGQSTTSLNNIKSFSVDLMMASPDSVNRIYPASERSYRFFPVSIN